jgi:hypothetical protein
MSRITVSILKTGLALEAELSRITRGIQKKDKLGYKFAIVEAEKRIDPVAYTQVLHSDSVELDLQTLGEHIAHGSPFTIVRD